MANVDSFPLLKLPYLPLANVIQQFDSIRKRVRFATLSRRTALLVESLKDIKVLGLKLIVSESLKLLVIYSDHGRVRHQGWTYKKDSNTLDFPFLVDYNHSKKLIDTMFFVFGLSGFEKLVVNRKKNETMEMSRLQNLLRNVNTIKSDRIYSDVFYKQALAAFPSVRNVSMTGIPNSPVLNEKLVILELGSFFYAPVLVKCESYQLPNAVLVEKDLNQFIKIWIKGRMPRLKHIRIQHLVLARQNSIFEGIENEEADQNRELSFKSYSLKLGDPETTVAQGGVDIKSENGARATVTFKIRNEEERISSCNIYVWD